MSPLTLIMVGLGGAAGALCRHRALSFMKPRSNSWFPWPTLLVNLASCTVAGTALAGAAALGQTAYIALTMGFLGGFSTLSTMNCEAVDMATEGHRGEAAAYLMVTYGSTLGAAALGFALAHAALGA